MEYEGFRPYFGISSFMYDSSSLGCGRIFLVGAVLPKPKGCASELSFVRLLGKGAFLAQRSRQIPVFSVESSRDSTERRDEYVF